jgi:glycosyltransferase involved in cell wall biosynthesis
MTQSARPLVTIVTPTLNQGAFIEQTIRSVRSQTYTHFEHIVVDGGSTDGTLDILREHQGEYPMRWTSEPDAGMYDAINKGMRLARGDILCYLNSDDLYFPWTLEAVVEAFDQHPEADLVCGDALGVFDESGAEDLRFQPVARFENLLHGGHLIQPSVFWRRRVYEALGDFDASLRLAGDLDWWLKGGPRQTYVRVDEMLAIERDHADAKRLSQWNALMEESVRSRSSLTEVGTIRYRATVLVERLRTWWSRRVLWARFVRASRAGADRPRPWARYLGSCRLHIPIGRALVAQVPWLGVRLAGGSIESGVDWLHTRGTAE